ncbi:recombination regulator RecX [Falsibacillus pallidus]|uniref:recombination regulator RecX n=1 Tax=Falsibacillus pallidus TaxID=493781 RepID=UPI003D95C0D9
MAIITKISKQVKNDERYNIFLDGKYAFSVDEDVLAKKRLQKGQELSDLDISEIQFHDDIRKGYNMALNYLTARMRTEKEIRTYLKDKEVEESIIPEIIFKLNQYKFINDEEFAIAFVRTQAATSNKGPVTIKRELAEKGVHQNFIERALEEFPFDQQLENAMKLAEKVVRQNQNLSESNVKQKIQQTLMRKGYSSNVIQEALIEVEFEKDTDEEWEAILYQGEKAYRRYSKFEGFEYKQKMKQALYRKGFNMELIDRFLEHKEEEEG